MAVEDFLLPTQSTQQSTQPTQEAGPPQHPVVLDTDIWGSLIPCNANNPFIKRVDFLRSQKRYAIGRSRRRNNDVRFPGCLRMSQCHCIVIWDGAETSTSAVTVKDLKSTNGTYINGRRLDSGESLILRDWNVVSFGQHPDTASKGDPRHDYRFFFRHMAAKERPSEGLYRFYDVQHVLGKGAYATVVKALHRMEGNWYAIKMFSGDRLRELLSVGNVSSRRAEKRMRSTAQHLQHEVAILNTLEHRYICQLKEAFFEGYSVSLVLELAPGGDLMSYVLQREVLLEPEGQYFTYQICEALAYVHEKGIVHRDLKPENVLLTDDHPPIVKVADFGLAKVIDSLSMLQTKCGTPAFVAPEVLDESEEGYDKVVDSWSLGVMVFMIIAKSSPFHDEAKDGPDLELLLDYNISEEGIDFIRRLLEYDPRLRMTPAQALEHDWLAAQAATERARMFEREQSLLRAEARRARAQESDLYVDSAFEIEHDTASTSSGTTRTGSISVARSTSNKRKAGRPDGDLTRSLSTMSVEDDAIDDDAPAPKRARGEDRVIPRRAPATTHRHGPCVVQWPAYDVEPDEVPGLGMFRDD